MSSAAPLAAAALLDRACRAWEENDLATVRDLTTLATGGAQHRGESLLSEALLSCVRAASGESGSRVLTLDDVFGVEPMTRGRICYYAALSAYLGRDYQTARDWLQVATPLPVDLSPRKLLLEADVAFACGFVGQCAPKVVAALEMIASETPADETTLVNALRLLAVLSNSMPIAPMSVALHGLLQGVPRTACALRGIEGWAAMFRGEHRVAGECFLREVVAASGALERLDACLDQMDLALAAVGFSGPRIVDGELDFVDALVQGIPWAAAPDASSLLRAASIVAQCGREDYALSYVVAAQRVHDHADARSRLAHGVLLGALIDEATALALRYSKAPDAAQAASRAYVCFDRLHFGWRAARMAGVLYQTSGNRCWQQRVVKHFSVYPAGAFPQILFVGTLTQREHEVLRLLRLGQSAHDIGTELKISENTVRTHLRNIERRLAPGERLWKAGSANAASR